MSPTVPQLRALYAQCYTLTSIMLQPIHIIRMDERSGNLFILAGLEETLEFEIDPQGRLVEYE